MEIVSADDDGYNLILEIDDLRVGLYMVGGEIEASAIASKLTSYTRNGPITSPEAYNDARSRVEKIERPVLDRTTEYALDITNVRHDDQSIHVFESVFLLKDVESYAEHGANLPLGPGQVVQAAIALLIARSRQRTEHGDDMTLLVKRISDYESRIDLQK